jgi:hypothetical protein
MSGTYHTSQKYVAQELHRAGNQVANEQLLVIMESLSQGSQPLAYGANASRRDDRNNGAVR